MWNTFHGVSSLAHVSERNMSKWTASVKAWEPYLSQLKPLKNFVCVQWFLSIWIEFPVKIRGQASREQTTVQQISKGASKASDRKGGSAAFPREIDYYTLLASK